MPKRRRFSPRSVVLRNEEDDNLALPRTTRVCRDKLKLEQCKQVGPLHHQERLVNLTRTGHVELSNNVEVDSKTKFDRQHGNREHHKAEQDDQPTRTGANQTNAHKEKHIVNEDQLKVHGEAADESAKQNKNQNGESSQCKASNLATALAIADCESELDTMVPDAVVSLNPGAPQQPRQRLALESDQDCLNDYQYAIFRQYWVFVSSHNVESKRNPSFGFQCIHCGSTWFAADKTRWPWSALREHIEQPQCTKYSPTTRTPVAENTVSRPLALAALAERVWARLGPTIESRGGAGMRFDQKSPNPQYRIGTRVLKYFANHGNYEGVVVGYNGLYYRVYYPADNDAEDLTQEALDQLDLIVDSGDEESE